MSVSRVFLRASRNVLLHCRNSLFQSPQQQQLPHLRNQFHYLHEYSTKASVLHEVLPSTLVFQRFGISTTTSPQPNEKEAGHEQANAVENEGTSTNVDPAIQDINATSSDPVDEAATGDAKAAEQKLDSDSETDLDDLSKVGLMKLVMEKEETLKMKQREIAAMQDKVLRSYAEMENVMDRTRREAENSKKFAIQGFAKSLLDVADNLSRASSVVKESFVKIDASKDTVGAMPLLKTLLEGVDMTEKQLLEVFKKSGVEKYDPTNEQFDPNRHNAVFQVPDNTKPVGTVAVVLKSGYTLYDRVIRPAEVGVTQAVENSEANQGSSES
ncbi:hypothetical protein Nepgr_007608 [Nepenthes gracilis]|uniref:GrpE protein homolog n=1 Tax=Nepenthes gracilis TaxID=150966 RepID=A0AAD3S7C0_NEPGR|nr:hypothetical protein Nepgr_007608 [Nepenthes gracilis]